MTQIPSTYLDRRVCIFGMGYVGLTLAVTMADVGFEVLGLEVRDDVLEMLGRGEPHFHEPGLHSQLRKLRGTGRLKFARVLPPNQKGCAYIITVGTPLGADSRVRMDSIVNVATELSNHLKTGDLVVMRSTVKLGTTREVVVPILDRAGVEYDIVFCPERTLEGQALRELRLLPQIVAGVSLQARVRAAQLFSFLTPTVVQVASLETAELIKLVDNTQRDVQFGFANEVARICDAMGISATEVIQAGKLGYPRTNLPAPGPVGGPCLEKDSIILAEGLERYGIVPSIALAARTLNKGQPEETVAAIARWVRQAEAFPERPEILLAGLAFKGRPVTDDLRGTMALPILHALRAQFPAARIRGYDAVVEPTEISRVFGIAPVSSLAEGIAGASLVVIANNHPEFAEAPIATLAERMARPGLIYDYWNNFAAPALDMPAGTAYMGLGAMGITPVSGLRARGAA